MIRLEPRLMHRHLAISSFSFAYPLFMKTYVTRCISSYLQIGLDLPSQRSEMKKCCDCQVYHNQTVLLSKYYNYCNITPDIYDMSIMFRSLIFKLVKTGLMSPGLLTWKN